jgi:hypothetical protein
LLALLLLLKALLLVMMVAGVVPAEGGNDFVKPFVRHTTTLHVGQSLLVLLCACAGGGVFDLHWLHTRRKSGMIVLGQEGGGPHRGLHHDDDCTLFSTPSLKGEYQQLSVGARPHNS